MDFKVAGICVSPRDTQCNQLQQLGSCHIGDYKGKTPISNDKREIHASYSENGSECKSESEGDFNGYRHLFHRPVGRSAPNAKETATWTFFHIVEDFRHATSRYSHV